jgi:hypothetical protein
MRNTAQARTRETTEGLTFPAIYVILLEPTLRPHGPIGPYTLFQWVSCRLQIFGQTKDCDGLLFADTANSAREQTLPLKNPRQPQVYESGKLKNV